MQDSVIGQLTATQNVDSVQTMLILDIARHEPEMLFR